MADKKISQLTAASTPLAGTEVLPIVQGGSTVKVSVANLTAGRAVSASSVTSSGAITSQNSVVSRTSTGGSFVLDSTTGGTENTITGLVDNGNLFGNINYVGNNHILKYGSSEVFRVKSDGNVAVANGNVQISTAARGIDFSANTGAAGMTSELLNWYEEGTWTPANDSMTVNAGSWGATGTYTRIGRIVFVSIVQTSGTLSANAGVGIITGLPFAVARGVTFNITNTTPNLQGGGYLETNGTFYTATTFSSQTALRITAVYQV